MPAIRGSLRLLSGLFFLLLLLVTPAARGEGELVRTTLDIPAGGETTAARLLVLPPGTRTVELESVGTARGSVTVADELAHVGRVMVLRGNPVAPVWLDAPAVRQLAEAGVERAEITLIARDGDGNTIAAGTLRGDARDLFDEAGTLPTDARALFGAAGVLPLSASDNPAVTNRGGYLIITADQYADELQSLIDWKTACGYEVSMFRTSETGGTLSEIEDFVRTAYETWETPPLYLLIVGDVEDVPTGDLMGNVTDHGYACVDGDDFLPDLHVGRFVAKNTTDVAVQVAKTVGYESNPDMTGIGPEDENTWFTRALMVAGNHGSSTPLPTSRWVADELRAIGFAQVDTVYYPPLADGCSQLYGCPLGDAIDAGVSIVNYRGWARENPPGWDVPDYTTDDVVQLVNGWKLPFVFSLVCNTGDYGRPDEDCFGEVWVKSGTVDEPQGAVGFFGTAEHWARTRWNDRLDLGIFEAICHRGVQQVGPAVAASKVDLLVHFPTEIYLDDVPDLDAVEFYAYIYNILGDPSLELWTACPRTVRIPALPRSIVRGTNYIDFRVTAGDGTTAVDGARVALVQGGELIGYGVTDVFGETSISLALASTEMVTCTVTGTNIHPLQMTMAVLDEGQFLTCCAAEVSGSSQLVPGVAADVIVTVQNVDSADIAGATATVAGPAEVEILEGTTEFGSIAAGETAQAQSPVRLRAAAETEDGVRLRFVLTPAVGGQDLQATEFWLTVSAPDLICTAMTDGDDGVFDPGEEFDLILTLRNDGSLSGGAITATLVTLTPDAGVTLIDSTASFDGIAPGTTADNAGDPFTLRLDGQLAVGTVIPLSLTATTADGPVCSVFGNLVVGVVDCAAPVGPDAYGYYCYDSADIDYPEQVPVYRWIEISPRYGGPGTWLDIDIDDRVPRIVQLPFTFTYYGEPYDSVRVSDNGWIAFDTDYFFDTRNWSMPDKWGSACQVAAFWDDLNPMIAGTDGIYSWYDAAHSRFVVEWNRLMNYEDYANNWQSFQIVLYDPAYHPTPTGDGEIVFQYKHIVNDDWETTYSTVGIEDQTEEIGIQYTYANSYADGASPLSPGLAIRFTTDAPVYEGISPGVAPLKLLSGNPSAGAGMILFRSGPGTAGEVAVFDAAGRRVRTLLQGEWGGSVGGVIAWDGRDAAGHRVPSGLYWVRLAAGSATRSTRLAIIR